MEMPRPYRVITSEPFFSAREVQRPSDDITGTKDMPFCPGKYRPSVPASIALLSRQVSPFCPGKYRPSVPASIALLSLQVSPFCPCKYRPSVPASIALLSRQVSPFCPCKYRPSVPASIALPSGQVSPFRPDKYRPFVPASIALPSRQVLPSCPGKYRPPVPASIALLSAGPSHDMNQTMANGPPQESPRQSHMYYPQLRPGYIAIPVHHDGVDNQQQYLYYNLPQPAKQRVKCEPPKRPQSPQVGFNRPQSPAWNAPEPPQPERPSSQHSGSPQGPSPPPSVADSSSPSQSPGWQGPGRPSAGSHPLPRGYIPIPVIHEGNGTRQSPQNVQQAQKTVYPQPDYQSHHPVFHKVQDERDSKQPVKGKTMSSRDSSPSRVSSPSPSSTRVQQIPLQRISPSRVQMDNTPTTVPVQMGSPTTVPVQMGSPTTVPVHMGSPTTVPVHMGSPTTVTMQMGSPTAVPLQTRSATPTQSQMRSATIDSTQTTSATPSPNQAGSATATSPVQAGPASISSAQTGLATDTPGQFSNTAPAQPSWAEAECKPSYVQKEGKDEMQATNVVEERPDFVEAEVAEPQEKHHGVLQVERILGRVQALQEAVANFRGRKNEKKYLMLEEYLTKELLALDSVDPEGRIDVRQARRDGVRKVQNILEALEQKAINNQTMDMSASSQDPVEGGAQSGMLGKPT
ncbi:PREDICTED: BAG family molecular chaperone regulator 3, partial [Nanorana parkeri]|uniref:BAG family molecular chaperone regulator 3 n=1 Tax=Nanorana parkeri TaxID=125878 RepID=UPI0008543E54